MNYEDLVEAVDFLAGVGYSLAYVYVASAVPLVCILLLHICLNDEALPCPYGVSAVLTCMFYIYVCKCVLM